MANARMRREAGGAFALTNGVICEILFSALLAPVLVLMQTQIVVDVLLGRDSGWVAQQRGEQEVPLGVVVGQHRGHTLCGIALAVGTYMLSVQVWLWLLPVWLGLSLAIPIAWLTSQREAGEAARRAGLFFIAGETERPDPVEPCAELIAPGIENRAG